ncbi:NADPH-dependent oxidoreductase [Aquimarina sp. AD10]|uniref:NADPH-dependent FMN reductase n=1 Tax=Aquimarina TaxID=290174 RepID=UPI000E4EE80E|nr:MULTISPECIES: NAD(P)H-dependent oxidoreductase [Aquimarina]AXT63233.1 NADPH-dependent oxidoreductase [Aquimarina sp. AD10]RKN00755.1 NADPH-dependent oxidoreductase [Aquimarina sp. AD10]
MKKIIALGGSNSKNSINKLLATYAANKVQNAIVSILDLNDFELPIYGVDLETENGIPENVKKLSNLIASTDGLVISLAEHNGSYTSSFKNTIDWLSRIDIKVWKDKPLLLLATSPGARGGATVLQSAKTYFPYLGGDVVADFSLASFYDNFTENTISNNELNEELNQKIRLFEQKITHI